MKILHIIEDYSINSGGLRTVVKDLHEKLLDEGYASYIVSSDKEKSDDIFLVKVGSGSWLYSKDWTKEITKIYKQKNIDIFHIHGVWLYPQLCGAKFALKNNIPFVVTPHGMYEPWIWKKGRLKKTVYFNLLTKTIYRKANIIHAITPDENNNLKKLFPSSNLYQIPNLIDHSFYDSEDFGMSKEKYILFVGRLHEKKGIDILIKAFAKLKRSDIRLKIAGSFNSYKTVLEKLVKNLNIEDNVDFVGLVKGRDKVKLYTQAFVFVAPSYSEVVGMVNLEAAICKTPVITTYQTGLLKSWGREGGILINPTERELYDALEEITKWSLETRVKNGKKLHEFVLENYSWKKRFNDWKKLYKSVLTKN